GAADEGPSAGKLLRQRASRRDGCGHAGQMRNLLRHDRRAGLLLSRCGGILGADRARSAVGAVGRSADDCLIRKGHKLSLCPFNSTLVEVAEATVVPPGSHAAVLEICATNHTDTDRSSRVSRTALYRYR